MTYPDLYRNVAKLAGVCLKTTQSIPDVLTTVAEVSHRINTMFLHCLVIVITSKATIFNTVIVTSSDILSLYYVTSDNRRIEA